VSIVQPEGVNEKQPQQRSINMDANKLEKGKTYIINNFGVDLKAELIESPKQGKGFKQAVLMHVFGEEQGFFNEMGSVYVKDIIRELS
jgi:hypothetical protein